MKKNSQKSFWITSVLSFLLFVTMLFSVTVEVKGQVTASSSVSTNASSDTNIVNKESDEQESISSINSSSQSVPQESVVTPGDAADVVSSEVSLQTSNELVESAVSSDVFSPGSALSSSSTVVAESGVLADEIIDSEENEFEEISPLLDETDYISVSSFSQLKTVLTGASQNKKIVLTEDIQALSGGININSSWTEVVIDGKDPVTGINHTYKEYNSTSAGDTIRITNSAIKSFTFQNLTIDGKNYYGPMCVYDGYLGVTVIYDSVKYVGPQITYNRYGTTRYIDCDISIEKNGASSNAEEVGEVLYVEIGGNTSIKSQTTTNAVFWLLNSSGSITILEGANVTVTTSYYFAYGVGSDSALVVEDGASFFYTGAYGLEYAGSNWGSVSVGENSTLSATQTETASSYPTLRVSKNLEVKNSGSLYIYQGNTSSAVYFANTGATFTMDSPKKVMLVAPNGKTIQSVGTCTISATVGAVNIWNTLPNGITNSLDDLPTNIWNQQDGSDFSLVSTLSGLNTSSVTTTWNGEATQWNKMLTKDTFTPGNAKLLVMGSYSLDVPQPIYTNTILLKGQANSSAQVGAYYNSVKSTGTAGTDGTFALPVDFSTLQVGDKVGVLSNHDQIKAYRFYEISEGSEGELKFLSVPSVMAFQGGSIPNKPTYIYRKDANWNIEVEDTRGDGSTWRLDASVPNEIQDSSNNVLAANLKLVSGSQLTSLSATPVTIYNGTTGTNAVTSIGWQADQGVLLWIDEVTSIRPNVSYTTTIEWDLIDAP